MKTFNGDKELNIIKAKMVSFVDALYKRYSDAKSDNCSIQIFIVGSLSPGKEGKTLILPPSLSLNGCQICQAGSQKKIRELCQTVEELDLASNHLIDLNEVFNIVKEMPFLKFLNLSENDFSNSDKMLIEPTIKLETVKSLVLNNTNVPWRSVKLLLDSTPNLNELHLSLNDFTAMNIDTKLNTNKYHNITRLYISKNPNLRDWNELENVLTIFPSLEILSMSDCNINTISADFNTLLPQIRCMNISNWPIECWTILERLNNSKTLSSLRCQGLHVLNQISCIETRRIHIIARLPNIQRLNGSEVSADERMHAEKAFLRYFLVNDDLIKPARYYTLLNVHGRVAPIAEINLAPPKTANVTVIYDENKDDDEKITEKMNIDLNKSVRDFKTQLSDLFGLPISQMRLYYVDHVMIQLMGPEEMKFNQKKLYTYNIQDGDEFIVDRK